MFPALTLALTAFLLQSPSRTIWDGVYTQAQAARGEAAYSQACARCHRDDLGGYGGVLLGGRFMDQWREDTLNSFFHNIQTTMPRDAPGSLSASAYVDIVAYILRRNDFPAGSAELTVASLPATRVQSKSGPEPVPDFALVEVAGCSKQAQVGTWQVIQGSEPARTRNPGASTPAELAAFLTKAPGNHTFQLMDVDSLSNKPVKDQTVLAKGFLIRQPNNDRINLTSLQTVSPTCR